MLRHTRRKEPRRLTSRKNRRLMTPLPASNQSITGSAYSCIEAVKTTSVYQVDPLRHVSAPSITLEDEVCTHTHLPQEVIHKWALIDVVQGPPSIEVNFNLMSFPDAFTSEFE